MKSFSILAGLVGLASAGNWNETWTQSPSSSSSWSSELKSSSCSSSIPEHKPTGWVPESSSSSVPVHKPTGWVPEHSSLVSTSSAEQNATSTLVTYVTTTVCPATTIVNGHTSIYTTTSTLTVTSCKGGCSKPTEAPSTWVPSSTKPAENVTSTEIVYTTTSLCPTVLTTVSAGKAYTQTTTLTSVLTITSCKGGCHKSTEAPSSSNSAPSVFSSSSSSLGYPSKPENVTSTEIVYTTTSLCPVTTIKQGHTFTYTTTSTFVVTSCKGGCQKPTQSVPDVTKTEEVYTTVTTCPATVTTVSEGKTYTKTFLTTSIQTLTSCKGGCSTPAETPMKPSQSIPVAPYPTFNATTQGHVAPSGWIPVPVPSPKTKTVTDVMLTTVTTCSSGEVISTAGSTTTLTKPSVITTIITSHSTITASTQGHAVPTAPVSSNGTTKYTTDITTTYLTTCPVTSQIFTSGTTKTTTYMTVSTAITVIKVSKTGSIEIPATSVPEAPKPTTITKYSTTEITKSCKECPSGTQILTTSYPIVVVETPASSPVSPVGTGKITVVVPVTQYTTTCPYTTVDEHGSTSVFLTTSIVSRPAESTTVPAQSSNLVVLSSASVQSKPVESTKAVVLSSAPVQSKPIAPSSAPVVVPSSAPAQSKPVESTKLVVPSSAPVAPSSVPAQSKPVESTKPVVPSSAPVQSKPVAPSSAPVASSSAPAQSKPAESTKPVVPSSAPVESHPASSPVSPVETTKPVESAPVTTLAASSPVKPTGNVVTQISDGQIQAPGPSSAHPAIPVNSGSVASSIASVLSSSVHANAPSSTSGTVASATTSTPAQYTGAASKTSASFMAAVAAMAAIFFF